MMLRTGIVLLILLATAVSAQVEHENHLSRFLSETQTLGAEFQQILLDSQGEIKETSSGIFFLSRPGKIRWDYLLPYRQTIISNADTLWIYDIDIQQVTTKDIRHTDADTLAAIFGQYEHIERQFTVIDMDDFEGTNWVALTPRGEDSLYQQIRISFDQGKLLTMLILDHLEQIMRIDFSETVINEKIDDNIFHLQIPEGVDVIHDLGDPS